MGKIEGIEITDLRVGTGPEITQNNCVALNLRMFLRRGEEVFSSPAFGPRKVINLRRRDSIAGLRKGIPGMRVGGIRQIVISPHLAYGAAGIPGRIPANALLRCEVELVAIREHSAMLPEDYSPGRLMRITKPNCLDYSRPHWTFEMHESGNAALYFSMQFSLPVRWHQKTIVLDGAKAASLIRQALVVPQLYRDAATQCGPGRLELPIGGPPVRDRAMRAHQIIVNISERNERILDYAVPETDAYFLDSNLFKQVTELVAPHLNPPAEASAQS